MINILRDILGLFLFIITGIFFVISFFLADTLSVVGGKVTRKYSNKLLNKVSHIIKYSK